MRSVWGMLVEVEPRDHLGYSNVSVAGAGRSRSRLVGDVKFKDTLSSNPEDVGQRGAFVGLGNTEPGTSADVFGLEQRGAVGDGDFRPSDGGGYVAYKKADYAHALSRSDTDVQMYLFETFGGWCNAVKRLFYQMKDKVRNKLSKRQHEDEASWSTRSWLSLQAQRMSVALCPAPLRVAMRSPLPFPCVPDRPYKILLVQAEAVRRGTLAKLSGRGKPLKEERESQAHIGGMPKNMEARAEAEMRRAERSGMLKNLGGEGAPLEQRHVVGAVSQQRAIQNHMQKETLR
ncbi:hypothetical protein EMIHUDRAFT_103150 [Emiliania huxleyi CCMP1516]|uniref:Uncharacterized protein n=2 Tax=Emiliania huxleyi TaxID=2903 RepID=A0A0D3IWI4_EMIH1|nr:hypothetical protein EMIHUDRAFT_103150 [Emiliania huxleyi CCMP1516]EOD15619.1 hypothetical protein EMIHUDRAFT_103150 [Emiliania huxleyi CCMP1516]|eukprot:XP_005768048.1 hypothetical protein EMIHUDRAFT_103150 [Emiliania huxleyi CCMP1516]